MDFLRPASWEEALAAKAEHPTAVPIAGGTDVMVEINFDHRRPEYLMDLGRIGDLAEWEVGADTVRLGASVSYTRIMENLSTELPGLALASHTVASPQIRNRGGVGGNLGTASPSAMPPTRRCWRPAPRSRPSRCAARAASRSTPSTPA
ncbi:Caffeine dehydrogenase subunit beta [Streptomyces badius]